MALSYNLVYQEIISVHPSRRQIFAGLSGTSENESYMVIGQARFSIDAETAEDVPLFSYVSNFENQSLSRIMASSFQNC